uniref:Uncharacterized protein n=1 Tax=Salix viminalis TaxID=40686 RepID=A0A6N2KT48_SALVM
MSIDPSSPLELSGTLSDGMSTLISSNSVKSGYNRFDLMWYEYPDFSSDARKDGASKPNGNDPDRLFSERSRNQDGKGSPMNLLWDRSTDTKSYWLRRKLGNSTLSSFEVLLEALKTLSWSFGTEGTGAMEVNSSQV